MVKFTSVQVKIYIIIITVAVVINICALTTCAILLTRSVSTAMEENLLIAVDIADKYVTKEIEIFKIMASEAARDINALYSAGETEGVLKHVCSNFSNCIGLAVFDDTTLLDSWFASTNYGESAVSPNLIHEPFMRVAMDGGQAVSTTMYSPGGALVMYISAPVSDGLVLAAAIPGMYFNNLMTQITFWRSGHLYTWDSEGTVISNIRPHWVMQRNNFFEMANQDTAYYGVSRVVRRGIEGERGIGHYSIDGIPRTCAFRPISSPNEGWSVGIVAPSDESPLKDIPRSILLMSIITLFLSSIATIIAAILLKRQYNIIDSLRRDSEYTHQQTEEKNRELEQLHAVKDKLFTVIAHDLRGPIGALTSTLNLAFSGEIDANTQSDMFKDISKSVEDVSELLDNLLRWAKNQMMGTVIMPVYIDAQDVTQSVIDNLHNIVVNKMIVLNNCIEKQDIYADRDIFSVVVRNLTTNAIKFTPAGGEITISSELSDNMLIVSVKDNGTGMSQEVQDKLFKLSGTKSQRGTNNEKGAGLGLILCAEFVKANGGNIWFTSKQGEGSTFYFSVPLGIVKE